jgi:hypothetical protein
MRKRKVPIAAMVGVSVIALLALSGCEREARVTAEEAEEAFMVAFGGAYVGSLAVRLDRPLPGMTLDSEHQSVVFDEFDVTDLETDYTTLAGRLVASEASAQAEFTLTGGVVETISFTIDADQMSWENGVRATVVVNGREMVIDLQSERME